MNKLFFPGVIDFFKWLKSHREVYTYCISSGIQQIAEASELGKVVDEIYAYSLRESTNLNDPHHRQLYFIDQTCTPIEKIAFIVSLSKGKSNIETDSEDYKIPFENIMYIGDNISHEGSDLPIMSFLSKFVRPGHRILVEGENNKDIIPYALKSGKVTDFILRDYSEGTKIRSLFTEFYYQINKI